MATIFPERLPQSIIADPKKQAEVNCYNAFARLPDPFVIFYSVAWQAKRQKSSVRDGEADFVVAHPHLGILVVEVKGGEIFYNAKNNSWTSVDRKGNSWSIKDPAKQARNSRYTLFEKFRELKNWDDRWLTIGYCVFFPDITLGNMVLKLDFPRDITIDAYDLNNLELAIKRVFNYYKGNSRSEGELGFDRLQLLIDLLANSFYLHTCLGIELSKEFERIIELTDQQLLLVDWLRTRRKAAIRGCAGSGKTMLAMEVARQKARQENDVLYLCYNISLANYVAPRLPGIQVMHFHGLCSTMAKQARLTWKEEKDSSKYMNDIMPLYLARAIDELGPQFDMIVVDEGQDFRNNWWDPIIFSLRDGSHGSLYIFYDDTQRIYQSGTKILDIINDEPFPLLENCRNTQYIHELFMQFSNSEIESRCRGPIGRKPDIYYYQDDQELPQMISECVMELRKQGVGEDEIVILTPRSKRRSILRPGSNLSDLVITWEPDSLPGTIRVSTIQGYKGLEQNVVILAELDKFTGPIAEELMYIGCSRARLHLQIFACDDFRLKIIE